MPLTDLRQVDQRAVRGARLSATLRLTVSLELCLGVRSSVERDRASTELTMALGWWPHRVGCSRRETFPLSALSGDVQHIYTYAPPEMAALRFPRQRRQPACVGMRRNTPLCPNNC